MKLFQHQVPLLLSLRQGLPFQNAFRMRSRCFGTVPVKRRNVQYLSTLKPDELRSSDFTELSHKNVHYIRFADFPRPTGHAVRPRRSCPGRSARFPDHARGFFYYHSPFGFSHMGSSIRFRCTPSSDPATFKQGKDLLTRFGLPWEFPMPSIIHVQSTYMQDYLVHAGLVTEDQMTHFKHSLDGRRLNRVFWGFDLPFFIDFNHIHISYATPMQSSCERMTFSHLFNDRRAMDGCKLRIPYKGSALARLELSTLPEHSGSQRVVIRCLKIQDPVTCVIPDYDGWVPPPREGELFHRRRRSGLVQPFSLPTDRDTPTSRSLKYLLEDHLQRSLHS